MSIFIVVVGSIVAGIATPTESAALGTVASLIAVAAYGMFSREVFMISVKQTLRFTVMTLFIICGSITFSQILAFSQASEGLVGLLEAAELAPLTVILVMMVILLFLGCFMDQVSMMMITMPIFMLIVEATDFGVGDLQQTQVWFGVLALMMLEISLATPPFGLLLFVAKGVAPAGTKMSEVITSVLPFILMAMAVAALLVFVPSITLIIPNFIAH